MRLAGRPVPGDLSNPLSGPRTVLTPSRAHRPKAGVPGLGAAFPGQCDYHLLRICAFQKKPADARNLLGLDIPHDVALVNRINRLDKGADISGRMRS